jgi:hypothetical protein
MGWLLHKLYFRCRHSIQSKTGPYLRVFAFNRYSISYSGLPMRLFYHSSRCQRLLKVKIERTRNTARSRRLLKLVVLSRITRFCVKVRENARKHETLQNSKLRAISHVCFHLGASHKAKGIYVHSMFHYVH